MSGDQAAATLLCVGVTVSCFAMIEGRYKTAAAIAIIFSAPLILRLFVAAVAG